jgi:cytoplasmic tRNA 2-thiolation protein 2
MRYLVALSPGGVSSTALLAVMWENQRQQRAKGKRARFEIVTAVVDTDLSGDDDDDDEEEEHQQEEKDHQAEAGIQYEGGEVKGHGSAAGTTKKQQRTGPAARLAAYRARFPGIEFRRLRLEDALGLDTIDWSAVLPTAELDAFRASLPPASSSSSPSSSSTAQKQQQRAARRLALTHLFTHVLPQTPSSREDMVRLLVRHLLIDAADGGRGGTRGTGEQEEPYDALLTGHSTTSLAALALAETARGRGFAVPWAVNDGVFTLPRVTGPLGQKHGAGESPAAADSSSSNNNNSSSSSTTTPPIRIAIYHPVRELFRKELVAYSGIAEPSLASVLPAAPSSANSSASVVSHRDLGISDVLTRYFAEVEASYPSVVANVVRTAGKLLTAVGADSGDDQVAARERGSAERCGLCGHALDDVGDERWRGELGEARQQDESESRGRLCYGCERSVYG